MFTRYSKIYYDKKPKFKFSKINFINTKEKKMTIKGVFISYWEEGTIETPAELHLETSHLQVHFSDGGVHYKNLIEEKFVSGGRTYSVCPNCHEYITKFELVKGSNDILGEEEFCRGSCEN